MYVLIFRTIFGYDTINFENHLDMVDFLNKSQTPITSFAFTYKPQTRKRK